MTILKKEADKLRQEAKESLSNVICGLMGLHTLPNDIKIVIPSGIDRAVDCIISAAILEVTEELITKVSKFD